MNALSFSTDLPFDHLQRALDTLRRMGFGLEGVSLRMRGDVSNIRLTFSATSPLGSETLGHRIASMPGVRNVKLTAPTAVGASAGAQMR